MDIAAIKARIAELEQRKAERNAMRGYRDVSYLDYMVNNDRSGFDRIDASEQAYRNMIEQQKFHDDQRQATQLFNEQQREIDRELSRELAEKQQTTAALDKMDELMKLRNKAVINVNYAEQALKYAKDKGIKADIDAAERDLQLAKEDLAYYNNRTGYKETPAPATTETTVVTEPSEPQVSLDSKIETYKSITKLETNALRDKVLNEMKSDPNFGQSKELQAQYERIKKITTSEEYKELVNKWRNEYEGLTPAKQREWKRNNPKKAKAIGV